MRNSAGPSGQPARPDAARRPARAGRWRGRLVGLAVVAALVCGAGARRAGAQEARENLVIFLDCSDAMSRPAQGGSLTCYQAAVQSASDEIKFALESGTPVRVIPFRQRALAPLDLIVFEPGKVALSQQLATAKLHFDTFAPKRGTEAAIWDTVLSVIPQVLVEGRRTAVTLYTTNQDHSSSTRAMVDARFKERYKDRAPAITLLNPVGELPPRAGVTVSGQLPILDAAAVATPAGAGGAVQVDARFSTTAGAANTFTVDHVDAAPLAGAPPIKVAATLAPALTKARPAGPATLSVTGTLPPGADAYQYDLQFYFRFRARPNDPVNPNDVIPAGRPVRVTIASTAKPQAQLAVGDADLHARTGEAKDVTVTVTYNAAASDKACELLTVPVTDLSAEWFEPGRAAPGPADKGAPKLTVTLPPVAAGGPDGSLSVVLRLRGLKPTKGQVRVTARVAGANSAAPPINVEVQAPVVQVALGGSKGERTPLVESPAAVGAWQDLGHPVTLTPNAPIGGATATLTVDGAADKDVDVAFDNAGTKRSTTVPIGPGTSVPLYVRLRSSAAAASPPSMPAISVTVSDRSVGLAPGATVGLDGTTTLKAADFWISKPEAADAAPGAAAGGAGAAAAARTLTLDAPKVRASQKHTQEVVLHWNAAAAGTVIDVVPDAPDGGRVEAVDPDGPVVAIEPPTPGTGAGAPAAGGPWRLQIPRPDKSTAKDLPTSALLHVRCLSPGVIPASKTARFTLRLTAVPAAAGPAGSPRFATPAPWDVQAPYNVAPTVFTVVVDKGGQGAIPLYVNASQPVANLRAWSDGLAGKLVAKFQPSTPGDTVGLTLGDQATAEVAVEPQGQQAPAEKGVGLAVRSKDVSKAGKHLAGAVVFRADIPDDPNAVVEVREAGDPTAAAKDRVSFDFDVTLCKLLAQANGKDVTVLPGERLLVAAKGKIFKTSDERHPVQFKLDVDRLPAEIASKRVRAEPTDPAGLIESVKFEVVGKDPQDEVELSDILANQVRGLVITASPDKGETLLRKGKVTLKVPDLAMSLPLEVNMRLPDPGHDLLWAGVAGVGIAAGLGALYLVNKKRNAMQPVPVNAPPGNHDDDEESLWGGGGRASLVPPPAPLSGSFGGGGAGAFEPDDAASNGDAGLAGGGWSGSPPAIVAPPADAPHGHEAPQQHEAQHGHEAPNEYEEPGESLWS